MIGSVGDSFLVESSAGVNGDIGISASFVLIEVTLPSGKSYHVLRMSSKGEYFIC